MAVGFIGYNSAITSSSQTLNIWRPQPSDDHDVMVACLYVLGQDANYPTIEGNTWEGWQVAATKQLTAQRTAVILVKQIKDANFESSLYQFTTTATLGSTFCFSGVVLGFTNATPVLHDLDDTPYTTSDTIVRAGTLWASVDGCYGIFYGFTHRQFASGPANWDTHELNMWCSGTTAYSCLATRELPNAVYLASTDATLTAATTVKHAFGVVLRPLYLPPKDLQLQSPQDGAIIAPGSTVDLTAQATDPNGQNIRYHFGTDMYYIGSSAWMASGNPVTLQWNPSSIHYGQRVLSFWAENSTGSFSGKLSVNITLAHALMLQPSDGQYHPEGQVQLVGKGYLPSAGQVRLQWEVDTTNPPSSSSPDYQLLTSPAVAQGEQTTATASCPTVGDWYIRARTLDDGSNPSDWSPVYTLHVLEGVRLLPGSVIQRSTLEVANKVVVKVDKADPPIVVSAVNEEGLLPHSASPREVSYVAPEGTDEAGALSIAERRLDKRADEQTTYSGLKVPLPGGLKLYRGQRVRLQVARLDVDLTATVRELGYDVDADQCAVTLGEFWSPQDRWEAIVEVFRQLQARRKEEA